MITHKKLKEYLDYNSLTGYFYWKISPNPCIKIGTIAGHRGKRGYITIGIEGTNYGAHRLAWFYVHKSWPENEIDHIDHNRSNNIFSNLREVTSLENQRNLPLRKNNKTGYHGLDLCYNEKYSARIKVNSKEIYLGTFKNKNDAIKARKEAEIKYGFHKNHGKTKEELKNV